MGKPSEQVAPVSVVNTDAAVVRLSSILGIPAARNAVRAGEARRLLSLREVVCHPVATHGQRMKLLLAAIPDAERGVVVLHADFPVLLASPEEARIARRG